MFLDLKHDPQLWLPQKRLAELSVCRRLADIHNSLPRGRPRLPWRMSIPTCTFGQFV
jgi:hypothetical protein